MQRAKNIFFAAGRRVAKGELFADDDPILNGRAALFEHVDVPQSAGGGQGTQDSSAVSKPTARKATTARKGTGGSSR